MSMITIEVVYADGPDRQRTVELVLAPGTTVAACLERVAALREFSGVAVSDLGRGVFGQVVDDAYACLLYTSPSPRDRQKSALAACG